MSGHTNPDQIRIAIAEARGWSVATRHHSTVLLTPEGNELWHYDRGGNSYGPCRSWEDALRKGSHYARRIPDYPNDLNAMHEAWKTLTPLQKVQFESHLYDVVVGGAEYHRNDDQPYITNATSAQRAEAFYRTIKQ